MRLFACVLVLAAACTKPGGIELDVTAISTITEVHVYIGTHDVAQSGGAFAVPQRAGSSDDVLQTSNVFSREADNGSDWLPYTPGQTLHFEFESGDLASLGAIIVVGFGADHQPVASWIQTDIALTPHQIDRFSIDLSGADPSQQVFIWGPAGSAAPPTTAPCAGVVTQGDGAHTGFIVTADDTDCDGYANDNTALECNAFYYDDKSGASLAGGNEVMPTSDTAECKLYGATCVDGVGPGAGFAPTTSCLPGPVCRGDCAGIDSALACLTAHAPTTNDSDTGYMCGIGTDTSGGNCAPLVLPRPPTGGYPCDSTTSGFLGSDGTLADDQVIDGIDFTFQVDDTCALTLTPNSSSTATGSGARVLLQVGLQNGTSLVLPVDISISSGACTTNATAGTACMVTEPNLQDPALTECVAGWSKPTPVTGQNGQAISGTAPALDGSMTNLFYISNGSVYVVSRASSADAWGSAAQLNYELDGLDGALPTFLHVSRDGSDLWIGAYSTSGDGGSAMTIATGGVWHLSLVYPLDPNAMRVGSQILSPIGAISYAPADASPDDVAVGTNDYELLDVVDDAPVGTPIVMGESPFFGDDATSLWFAAPQGGYVALAQPAIEDAGSGSGSDGSGSGSGGSGLGLQPSGVYWIYVDSRTDATMAFPNLVDPVGGSNAVGPVQLVELGSASYPEDPWLSSDLHTIYFSSDLNGGTGTSTPFLYVSTR